jgi:hypothetical protein
MDFNTAGFELPKPLEPEPADKSSSTTKLKKFKKMKRAKVTVLQKIKNINIKMKGLP